MQELIKRLRDASITGLNLTIAACEAADLIESQAAEIAEHEGCTI